MGKYTFTSESVSEGHPDKLADQVSDAVLDACLSEDKNSRVACETFTTTGMVLVGGEITTHTYVDLQDVVRSVVKDIGYTNPDYGLDYQSMSVLNAIHAQSPDIAQGVNSEEGTFHGQGAGDQGLMFGYACKETPEYMPAPIVYSHALTKAAAEKRKSGDVCWMRPDAKSQVSVMYENGVPKEVSHVVFSQQHDEAVSHKEIEETLIETVIKPTLESTGLLTDRTTYLINPTGKFVIGGPHGDAGLTGRKIIVDTYGGVGRHGGGAFSGKDPSKVDRSAAYMARYIAKNLVAADLCDQCEIQLSYAIGYPEPVSFRVMTFGTGKISDEEIETLVKKHVELTPKAIIDRLDLLKPIYRSTVNYGHFGRPGFSWEELDLKADLLRAL